MYYVTGIILLHAGKEKRSVKTENRTPVSLLTGLFPLEDNQFLSQEGPRS